MARNIVYSRVHQRVMVDVVPADGRTLEQIADALNSGRATVRTLADGLCEIVVDGLMIGHCAYEEDDTAAGPEDCGYFVDGVALGAPRHLADVSPGERSSGPFEVRWCAPDLAVVATVKLGVAGVIAECRTSALVSERQMLANATFIRDMCSRKAATKDQIQQAMTVAYDGGDRIEIDDDAVVERGDHGLWVSAWVYLPPPEGEGEGEGEGRARGRGRGGGRGRGRG